MSTDTPPARFESTLPSAAELAAPLPAETDVAIVGGGIIGCSLAYYLAREGVEVTLVERGELNREASGTNAGSFHLQIAIHQLTSFAIEGDEDRLLEEERLLVEAAALWAGLEEELNGSLEMHIGGGLMVAETAEQLRLLDAKQRIEQRAGLETHVLSGPELRDFAPYLSDELAGASFCPQEGHANPLFAAPLFARRASERGAAIRTGAPVRSIERGTDGSFTLETGRGRLRAARVVNAAGAWSSDIAGLLGRPLATRREGLHVNVTEPRAPFLEPLVQHIARRLTLKQSSSGTFIIGGGWPSREQPGAARYRTLWASAAGNAAVALHVIPQLRDVRVIRTWSGVMAFTEDFSPIVGESRAIPGYYTCVATTGFTLGPLMARLLADHMTSGAGLPTQFAADRGLPAQTTRS